jgi:hypothetical protein
VQLNNSWNPDISSIRDHIISDQGGIIVILLKNGSFPVTDASPQHINGKVSICHNTDFSKKTIDFALSLHWNS